MMRTILIHLEEKEFNAAKEVKETSRLTWNGVFSAGINYLIHSSGQVIRKEEVISHREDVTRRM